MKYVIKMTGELVTDFLTDGATTGNACYTIDRGLPPGCRLVGAIYDGFVLTLAFDDAVGGREPIKYNPFMLNALELNYKQITPTISQQTLMLTEAK